MALHRLHRFFYSTSFTLLFLFLVILLLITPADAVVQAYFRNAQLYNVFVVAGTYVLTAAIALAIYVSRIYSVRSLMAEIPKGYVPVKKMDLPKRVHKAIVGNLSRSAMIAVQSRPGAGTIVGDGNGGGGGGTITHPGWSPPSSVDLPDVNYLSVIFELPHLIEAKALSLQPPPPSPTQPLGRQPHQTLRAYLAHLSTLGYVHSPAADQFLDGYERARFRTRGEGVQEGEFRDLMRVFAGLLRGMGDHTRVSTPSTPVAGDDDEGWRAGGVDGAVDEESAGMDEEGYSEAGSVRRRFGYMSLGYETTTTYDEEDGGYYGSVYQTDAYDPYVGQYVDRENQRERERFVERERIRIRNSMGGVMMERDRTETTTETSSMGSEGGSYGIEMQPLDPGMLGRRLSVRASTGTFG